MARRGEPTVSRFRTQSPGVAAGEVARGEAVDAALQDLLGAARGEQDADAAERLGPQALGDATSAPRR
jgi:hypothetical protein